MGAVADAEAPGCKDKRRKSGWSQSAMTDAILVLNGGSSSLKFAVFQQRDELHLLVRGSVSSIGRSPRLHIAPTAFSPEIDRGLGNEQIGRAHV